MLYCISCRLILIILFFFTHITFFFLRWRCPLLNWHLYSAERQKKEKKTQIQTQIKCVMEGEIANRMKLWSTVKTLWLRKIEQRKKKDESIFFFPLFFSLPFFSSMSLFFFFRFSSSSIFKLLLKKSHVEKKIICKKAEEKILIEELRKSIIALHLMFIQANITKIPHKVYSFWQKKLFFFARCCNKYYRHYHQPPLSSPFASQTVLLPLLLLFPTVITDAFFWGGRGVGEGVGGGERRW